MDLIVNLPDIIFYLVTGFIFLRIFHFVALTENSKEIDHILSSSLVVGYVIVNSMHLIPFSISPEIDGIGICLTSCFTAIILGKLYTSNLIDTFCNHLGINTTTNRYMWNNLYDKENPIKIYVAMEDGNQYKGYAHFIEPYNNTPMISLAGYYILNKNGIWEKPENVKNKILLLNLSNAKTVEIEYIDGSNNLIDIATLISNDNEAV